MPKGRKVCVVSSDSGPMSAPTCPSFIPPLWLAPERHPRLFCTSEEVAIARWNVGNTEWGRAYLVSQRKLCDRFVAMTPEQLRALIPPPGSKFMYWLEMKFDPIHGKRMRWAGWENPFFVLDSEGRTYPNSEWPDRGDGVQDNETGKTHHFIAHANSFIVDELDRNMLPTLADVYALTRCQECARTAAILFDALAPLYPTTKRGPLDYPTVEGDVECGRLNLPYFHVARGLMNLVIALDLLASSGELEEPSATAPGTTIRENVIRNFLWDGASYCHKLTLEGYQLHNGQADAARGAAVVGILLGVRELAEPMLKGPLSLDAMLAINIDRNGLYYEGSSGYATGTRQWYITMAELVEAARRIGWSDVPSAYANPAMQSFLTEPFNRQEVGGHMPALGDAWPDRSEHDPMRRLPGRNHVQADVFLKSQIDSAWVRLVRSPDQEDRRRAVQLLRDSFGEASPTPPAGDQWSLYHIRPQAIDMIRDLVPNPSRFETGSTFYGAKGLALLRGGDGSNLYGAQLFFGPVHNHGQKEALTWLFFARGSEWSFDPGYYKTHYRFGWTTATVSHQAMVVNATSCDPSAGGGYLVSWHDTPMVQWALARHPDAYREQSARRYERLVTQVHDASTGQLGYWFDVGVVSGGNLRDDSFHTQMRHVALDVPLPLADSRLPSLYGDKDLRSLIGDDYRLHGKEYEDKPFYWAPPGEGYGFLGDPKEAPLPDVVRAVFSEPAFAETFRGALIADLLGASGRRLMVADGPGPAPTGMPSVPYLLRRDGGEGTSIFAKVLRLVEDPANDHLASVRSVPVESADDERPGPAGWCITWTDGKRDVWLLRDVDRPVSYSTAAPDLPQIETDAVVALVRISSDGRISAVHASAATRVAVEGSPALNGAATAEGRVLKVRSNRNRAAVTVEWNKGAETLNNVPSGALLISLPPEGQPASWRVARLDGRAAEFEDVKAALAAHVQFTSVRGKRGWYAMYPGVSRLFSLAGGTLPRYAVGKSIYFDKRCVARIAELAPDGRSVRLETNGQPARVGEKFTGAILEVGPGDRVIVPIEREWQAD